MKDQGGLCLFLINDPQGMVDASTFCYLRALEDVCDRIVLICGQEIQYAGELNREKRWDSLRISPTVSSRVKAFGQALDQLGWEAVTDQRLLLLTGDFMMGPVNSMTEMFRVMENRDADFWGVAAKGWWKEDSSIERRNWEMTQYVPLDFLALRGSMLQGNQLRGIWNQTGKSKAEERQEAPEECRLTRALEDAGFRWDVYIPTPEEGRLTDDYLLMNPVPAIRDGKSPVFQKEIFTHSQMDYLCVSAGEQPWELYRYLQRESDYDTEALLRNLIRTCHQDDISRSLRMTYVLPSDAEMVPSRGRLRVALVMHLYYMDLLPDSVHYARSMPKDADFYLVASSEENAEKIRESFKGFPQHMEIRVTENRGRDVGSLLVGTADIQDQYDLICFYHDKKTNHVWPHTAGQSFAYKLSECALSTPEYVRNVISLFETREELGMLTGTTPNHAEFLSQLGSEWSSNFEITRNLARDLGFHVPMAEDHIPAIGLGDVFWYRTKAMAPLFRKKWTYEDFPEEPVGPDGTVLHAIERLYPFAVQEAGYLPGKVMPDHLAALEIENLSFFVREYNLPRLAGQIYGDMRAVSKQEWLRLDPQLYARAQAANFPTQFRLLLKRGVPKGLYRAVLKGKRAIFGPRDVTPEDEEATDSLLEDTL